MTSEATTATPLEVLNEALEAKVCTKCGESKALGFFTRRKDGGYASWCNTCRYAPYKAQRDAAREVRRAAAALAAAEKKAAHVAEKAARQAAAATERCCRVCAETKPIVSFGFYNKSKTGRKKICIQCFRVKHAAKVRADRLVPGYKECPKSPAYIQLHGAKNRAKEQGLAFNLTIEDIFVPEYCPVLGIKLERAVGKTGKGRRDNSPSLDRLIPERGYVKGNVTIISDRANRIRNNGTAEEHERIAAWMRSQGLP